ncbi:MAG: hypothetical protein FJX74_12730, partial [Armatimonadetes bacterium]|nr:hypothetical protein [Armatimonadota bacterium]
YSSRRIAWACEERMDFRAITAHQTPDFRTIAEFRRRHLKALGALFGQVLALCQEAGLVKLGHVALDGTKLHANASKHKAMSYGRMKKAAPERAAEVAKWFAEAETTGEAEDAEYGADRRGDELPEWVVDKVKRLAKMREAMAALEAEAAAQASATGSRTGGPQTRAMAQRLKRGGHRSRYRLRKQTVEPVFGQIKAARGFRQFLLRGLEQVRQEWNLVCMAHNLLKLAGACGVTR